MLLKQASLANVNEKNGVALQFSYNVGYRETTMELTNPIHHGPCAVVRELGILIATPPQYER